ncbi:hypothetical protein RJ45_02180 [Photobacterium gaetbulicola]|uniref:Uncharacterized protein n=2 Tax=Photobacterium gaetbulicola TaxID=1295392 RepID=A0A0B9H2W8_9GAMM|nr:hypothetical protein RJ45_02180 [Photobacterium gaetbulicola]
MASPTFNAIIQVPLNSTSHHVAIEYAKQAWRELEDLVEEKLGAEVKENDLPRLLGRNIFMLTASKAA